MARAYTLKKPVGTGAIGARIDYAAELNPQQLEAVTTDDGPVLVIAGAGSGKTRTLTYRVAYLLQDRGVDPSNILLLTFTNKASREMLERVSTLLPDRTAGLWGGTFHSVGNRILRRHGELLGFRRGFSIMDREDQESLLKTIIPAAGVDPKDKRFPKAEVLSEIYSLSINMEQSVKGIIDERYPYFLELTDQIVDVRRRYEAKKLATNSLDFDDLLEKTLRLLNEHPEAAEFYQSRFQYVLVDEYQDTNKLQADFVDKLVEKHGNLMVVGDDAQSIYSWRGADFRNIIHFNQRYSNARSYKIETNYRSTPEILEVANAAIENNVAQFPKVLHAARESRDSKPALIELNDGNQQALFITQRVLELRDEGTELHEMAVLYRAHFHSMELQLELTRHGVPFQITSGLRFFEQAHVKDVAAFLKFGTNHRDEVAFKRIARLLPGVGGIAAERLWGHFEKTLGTRVAVDSFKDAFRGAKVPPKTEKTWQQFVNTLEEIAPEGHLITPASAIESVVEAVYDEYAKAKFPNYENRREDLNVLANYARQYADPNDFLSQLALVTNLETAEVGARGASEDKEQLTLTSVHQAKGLEWKVVFVIGLTEGSFPSSRSLDSAEAVEEERRLFYVAVTRAEDELYLTYPYMRLNAGYGGDMFQRPSRFLGEVPENLVEKWEISRGY